MTEKIMKQFAKKWGMRIELVQTIYWHIDFYGGKYGKASRFFRKALDINLSTRQLKYFYRKIRLTKRYGNANKIGKKNYRTMVLRKS